MANYVAQDQMTLLSTRTGPNDVAAQEEGKTGSK
jgi:hypothetical protein